MFDSSDERWIFWVLSIAEKYFGFWGTVAKYTSHFGYAKVATDVSGSEQCSNFVIAAILLLLEPLLIPKATMKKAVYSGILLVCLATMTMPAVAKGKPQKAQKTQNTEQTSDVKGRQQPKPMMCQGLVGLPHIPGTTQQQTTYQQTTTQQQSVQGTIAQQQTNVLSTSVTQHEHEMEMEPGQQNLRSNRGGQLRGQARAQKVHEMNAAKGKKAKGQKMDQTCGQMPMSTDATRSGKVEHSSQSDRPTNR